MKSINSLKHHYLQYKPLVSALLYLFLCLSLNVLNARNNAQLPACLSNIQCKHEYHLSGEQGSEAGECNASLLDSKDADLVTLSKLNSYSNTRRKPCKPDERSLESFLGMYVVNNPPVAIDDINTTLKDVPVDGQVLTNDLDPDGDNISVKQINGIPVLPGGTTVSTSNGTVTIFPDGNYIYTPDPGYAGSDQFTYEICDDGIPGPLCATAIVSLEILPLLSPPPANNKPVANIDAAQTEVNTPLTIRVISNDFDPDGDLLSTPTQISSASNGSVTQNPDGSFTYTPNSGFTGKDGFSYEICDASGLCDAAFVSILVRPDNAQANDPPVAIDDAIYGSAGTPVSHDVSQNDFDPDGDSPLVFSQISTPMHGSVVFNPDGSFTYTPDPGYTGPDQFIYEVCDGISGCDKATVYLPIGPLNNTPFAIDDINNTLKDVPVDGQVLTNDFDPEGDNISVKQINSTPVLVAGTTVSTSNGTITIYPDGSYIYTPDPGYAGSDQFTYEICDDGIPGPLCTIAIVSLEILPFLSPPPSNNKPVANVDATQTEVGTPVTIRVASNDFDPDGDPLSTPTQTSISSNGNVSQNPAGSFTYTPNPGFVGKDGFTYEICDPLGLCDAAFVSIIVRSDNAQANDPPVAIDDAIHGPAGTPVSHDVSQNDLDPDGDSPLIFTQISTPSNGYVVFNPDGSYTYTPNAGYNGPDKFAYEVCDGISGCDKATAHLLIGQGSQPSVFIWTGNMNNAWSVPGNWENGIAPGVGDDVIIPAAVPNDPYLQAGSFEIGKLTLEVSAFLLLDGILSCSVVSGDALNNQGIIEINGILYYDGGDFINIGELKGKGKILEGMPPP
jgi:hypothetical protein